MTLGRIPRIASRLLRDQEARKELKRRLDNFVEGGFEDVFRRLPIFVPTSGGDAGALAKLTLAAAQNAFPLLVSVLQAVGNTPLAEITPRDFCDDAKSRENAKALAILFDKYGSDKTSHEYHYVYGKILRGEMKLLEIGLGTNNEDVVSTMGRNGKPGASLRAFRDFLPASIIRGADIDRRILFAEQDINTFYADQTSLNSLNEIPGKPFDLIIDDGLHTVDANLNVLLYSLSSLRPGGWLVIEDILPAAQPVWQIVASLLPRECRIIRTASSLMFVMRQA